MKKKIVILDHIGGGRLANQLWNYMGLYSYCLEKNYALENYAFFDYINLFNIPYPTNPFIRFFLYTLNQIKFYRKLHVYDYFLRMARKILKNKILEDDRVNPFYLPPTSTSEPEIVLKNKTIYTSGWLFRNPVGIKKYREQIIKYFKPKESILKKVDSVIGPLREKYKNVVGVHIRQTDYKVWMNGKYYFSQDEVRKILNEYLKEFERKPEETVFVICSDGNIDESIFSGLNIHLPKGNLAEDLFTLSKTDVIIGNDSTYSAFASYYGNIPFIVFEREGVEWDFYRDKSGYFENKKNVLVWY